MKQEDKDLLLRDLCCRLPYGVKLSFYASATNQTYICTLLGIEPNGEEPVIAKTEHGSFYFFAGNVKPYLFPMSSMNEEQKIIYGDLCYAVIRSFTWDTQDALNELYTWLNKNHFDYNGLIPLGLAKDATNLNIYKL